MVETETYTGTIKNVTKNAVLKNIYLLLNSVALC